MSRTYHTEEVSIIFHMIVKMFPIIYLFLIYNVFPKVARRSKMHSEYEFEFGVKEDEQSMRG